MIVNRSTDGGLSWGRPVGVAAASATQDLDKTWITCDNTRTSPHYGNCYVEWDDTGHMNQLAMAFSSDGGITWTASAVPAGSGVIAGQPLAQPNGTVIVPIDNSFETALESFVSTDGGVSYIGPFQISTIINHNETNMSNGANDDYSLYRGIVILPNKEAGEGRRPLARYLTPGRCGFRPAHSFRSRPLSA